MIRRRSVPPGLRSLHPAVILLLLMVGGLLLNGCSPFSVPGSAAGREVLGSPAAKEDSGASNLAPPAPVAAGEGISPEPIDPAQEGAVNPLTGLPVSDPSLLERRPLMIKVSNFPVQGRPHAGLSYADIVFEYFIGAGMTRFTALYYGQDAPRVGPIRSGRLIDGQLARLYGSFLGMKGADPGVGQELNDMLPGRVFNAKPSTCPALCPETVSHTYGTFADTAAFTAYAVDQGADNRRPVLAGMQFDPSAPPGGQTANRLWLFYSNLNQVAWVFDPVRGVYLREQDNADAVLRPMPDQLTGEQLAFENVVVLFAEHTLHSPTLIEMTLWFEQGQTAWILRDGQRYEVTWAAPSADRPIRFFHADGTPFAFKPGRTWVQIVGLGARTEQLDPGLWKVRFYP